MNDEYLLLGLILIAILGTAIIILRKLNLGNEYIWDSAEWLIVGTAPLILAVSMIHDQTSKNLFIGVYISIIVIWGIFSVWNKKLKIERKISQLNDDQKIHQARPIILVMFVGMIIFVILTFLKINGNI